MKMYTVVDNATPVLTTTDLRKAQEAVYNLARKYDDKQSWFWVTEEELK